jgi:hypothetical protein
MEASTIFAPLIYGAYPMPAKFEGLGIAFLYPDNWTLDDSDAILGRKSVTVFSPGGAFWSVAIHSSSTNLAKLAKAAVETMRKEYSDVEAEEVSETIAGHDLSGYDLNFYCLDLTNTAQIRAASFTNANYILFCQAEDREFEKIKLVFQAISTSLLNTLDNSTEQL